MTSNSRWLEALVMRVQADFLDCPALSLTLTQAQQRFGVDGITCAAVLRVLVDAQVLTRTRHGAYTRFFRRRASGGEMRGLQALAMSC
jgi:hypothetical protein